MEARDRRFEEAWQEALEGAQCNPPDHIWAGIEDALEGRKRKPLGKHKRLWLLKLAMAATLLYGMSTSGLNLHEQGFSLDHWDLVEELLPEVAPGISYLDISDNYSGDVHPQVEMAAEFTPAESLAPLTYAEFLPTYDYRRRDIRKFPMLPLYRKNRVTGLRTSMNFAGGAGNSAGQSVSSVTADAGFSGLNEFNMARSVADSHIDLSGPVFNAGVGLRARLSERWVVQTGINYQERSGSGTANYINQGPAGDQVWVSTVSGSMPEGIRETLPYAVDHRLQYISVPVQAGYVVLDNKVDVTIYGGISNDILVGHKVSDPERKLASANITDSSSFRKYGVSGILTAEISYPISDNYSVSVYPQVRQALTSLTEDHISKPLTMEMGVKLSYNIN